LSSLRVNLYFWPSQTKLIFSLFLFKPGLAQVSNHESIHQSGLVSKHWFGFNGIQMEEKLKKRTCWGETKDMLASGQQHQSYSNVNQVLPIIENGVSQFFVMANWPSHFRSQSHIICLIYRSQKWRLEPTSEHLPLWWTEQLKCPRTKTLCWHERKIKIAIYQCPNPSANSASLHHQEKISVSHAIFRITRKKPELLLIRVLAKLMH
jgi:hypothetical protein